MSRLNQYLNKIPSWAGETLAERNPSMVRNSRHSRITEKDKKPKRCPYCKGRGKEVDYEDEDRIIYKDAPCPECDGTGKDITELNHE